MREETTFRGRNEKHGWIYGHHFVNRGLHFIVTDGVADPLNTYSDYTVNPSTVGQRTGVRDKHGNHIYEGDIVELQDPVAQSYYGFDRAAVRHIGKYACFGFVLPRPEDEVEEEMRQVLTGEHVTEDVRRQYRENFGNHIVTLADMLRPSFQNPAPNLAVIGNIHDNSL